MSATFQHVEKADDVGVRVGVRVDQRVAHAGLGGEIHHKGKAMGREQRRHRRAVGKVQLLEPEVRKRLEPASRACFSRGS